MKTLSALLGIYLFFGVANAQGMQDMTGPDGSLAGFRDGNSYYNAHGNYDGRVAQDGAITDSRGAYDGSIAQDGFLTGRHGDFQGRINGDGSITDSTGSLAGKLWSDGTVTDKHGSYAGRVPQGDRLAALKLLGIF